MLTCWFLSVPSPYPLQQNPRGCSLQTLTPRPVSQTPRRPPPQGGGVPGGEGPPAVANMRALVPTEHHQ